MTRSDDRAVSTVLGYSMTLGIATLLVAGLLVATGGYVQDQRERVVRTELTVVGNQLAGDLTSADTLGRRGADTLVLDRRLPHQAAGTSYIIAVNSTDCDNCLVLIAPDVDVTVQVDLATNASVSANNVTGGPVIVRYDSAGQTLEVQDG